jgi:hypothetical protein
MTDGFFKIQGRFFVGNEIAKRCQLDLYVKGKSSVYEGRVVEGLFEQIFIVAPKKRTYYTIVECVGSLELFRSEAFTVSFSRSSTGIVDLGSIYLESIGE